MTAPRDERARDALEVEAEAVCAHCAIEPGPPAQVALLARLREASAWLDRALRYAADPDPAAAKASEWLLDNQHHLRRAIRQVRTDMPPGFYRRLPRCAAGECAGLPRIYMLAHRFLDANHMQVGLAATVRFVDAVQRTVPLNIAELWAFPVMLRLACLEMLILAFSELAPDLDPPIGRAPGSHYAEIHDPTETVSRAVMALIVIHHLPWKEFFDRTSRVEAILRRDPAGVYAAMDFDTRDRYRKAVEEIAAGAPFSEWDVAEAALELARTHRGERRRGHVGCWLVAEGRRLLERRLGFRAEPGEIFRRLVLARPTLFYFGGITAFTTLAMVPPGILFAAAGLGAPAWALGMVLALLPASIIGITFAYWLATMTVPPRVLPKLDFDAGLPEDLRGAIVVPVILAGPDEVAGLMERLERHWLANGDPQLNVALLSDPADADVERLPEDEALEAALIEGVRALNRRYAAQAPFVLLHRRRQWNPAEGRWMAWERKRGKLEQFAALLAGEGDAAAFPVREGDFARLKSARFVVTLDLDTQAPPGTVRRLAGAFAHPLNRVELDAASRRPRAGYTFFQPRVEISPEAGNRSLFTRLYTGDTAIDIYSRAVSDVYQDLFGEGIFTGKGAFDPVAFHHCLEGRVPENALLSHDLFEGLHGRAALVSDVVFYEDFPSNYLAYMRRWHRWVRGDWQLLPWLAPRVPGRDGRRLPNPLSLLDRWKILDNLRRSLIPPGLIALALFGWLTLPSAAWLWTLLVALAPGAYLFTDLMTGLVRGRRRGAVRGWLRRLADHAGRWLLAVAFMANEAVVAGDAIARTLWRLAVSRRHLLEWTTAAHVERLVAGGRARYWLEMAGAPVVAAAGGLLVAAAAPGALAGALPLLALWFLSPEIAFRISRERRRERPALGAAQRAFLRRLARRTWLFFETFAGPDDNWLPPDNFQTDPHDEIAHRTSPTNIAMLMTSAAAARDLGHIELRELATRLAYVLDSLDRMERYRGHLLNWYDTRSLAPLEPRYVSTVDSGNLAVALVTLAETCREARGAPLFLPALWQGLADELELLAEAMEAAGGRASARTAAELREAAARWAGHAAQPAGWFGALEAIIAEEWPALEKRVLEGAAGVPGERLPEIRSWVERVGHHLAATRRDLADLAPWLAVVAEAPPPLAPLAAEIAALLSPDAPCGTVGERAARARERVAAAEPPDATARAWLARLDEAIDKGVQAQEALAADLDRLADRAEAAALAMDFRFLFDPEARTFFIGYNVSADRMDPHHYDLLASEARLASYFAIAKGDAPVEHWFHLGRPIARVEGELVVLSWNGSMFEYLMPRLFLRSDEGRLLGQSERVAVKVQRRYGERLRLPWGVSESAYAARDAEGHYQYQAFGVPGLGLRRGLGRDYVVAPYATELALMVAPGAALANLHRLARLGALRLYGFWEALDFTPERRPEGADFVPVKAFMAHHQGMSLTAVANILLDDVFVARFMRNPRMQAVDLLLQERVPWELPPETPPETAETAEVARTRRAAPPLHGWPAPEHPAPQLHLVGNGRMASWITDSGAGALWWQEQALTRWSADLLTEEGALRVFLHEPARGTVHPLGRRPPGRPELDAEVFFHAHMAEFHHRLDGLSVRMDVSVAPADDVELRRVALFNESDEARELVVATAGEVVLAPWAAHERHPAFSKLFVHSEALPDGAGLLFERRPRGPGERPPVLLHRLIAEDPRVGPAGFETDRRALLGRDGDPLAPRALREGFSGSAGWTLDPVLALGARIRLAPGERASLAFVTVAAGSRESALEIASRYASLSALDWAVEDAARSAALEAHRLGLGTAELMDAQAACRELVAPRPRALDVWSELPAQPHLWALGVSGDFPICLLRAGDEERARILPTLVRAHRWWRRRGLRADLVVLRTGASGYEEPVRERLLGIMREAGIQEGLGGRGGVHLHFADRAGAATIRALEACAGLVFDAATARLVDGRRPRPEERPPPPRFEPLGVAAAGQPAPARLPPAGRLEFDNGIGGFADGGAEYVIGGDDRPRPPAPWCNVLANSRFGTIVSEAGLGFSWGLNAGEHRLTPWFNDPLLDPQGEAIYIRDEESGTVWTPTPAPAGPERWRVHHRPGLTTWFGAGHGIESRLRVFVPPAAPVKLAVLRLTNPGTRPRHLSLTYYAEWNLGAVAGIARPHVVCGYEPDARALVARSGWNPDFAERAAFLAASRPIASLTCERTTFLGRHGRRARPEALERSALDGACENVADPCAALQLRLEVAPGASEEVIFVLGEGGSRAEVLALAGEWVEPQRVARALDETLAWWDARLGALTVETPDRALDILVNRWLPCQALASRILARAGFHQAGGAFGFRDQLQDMMVLLHVEPARVRAHLLECAARQFEEGDVLHWWHPPAGRGVRTRCSDDLLWLPYATARYVAATGDVAVLDEVVPFLSAPPLADDEEDRYALFSHGAERGTLFEHCRRALERGVTAGAHGLPLIGSGDWNDGMDRVGRRGRGESVWLAWFAAAAADGFADLAGRVGRRDLARLWHTRAEELRRAADAAGWDGEWYLRAFDDDGLPWGSRDNDECRIDSIAQSWSVLTGGSRGAHAATALASARAWLVDEEKRLVKLLTPPFDRTPRDPGYIRAYPPGVRENGGQYTHAAAWLGLAHALLGDGARAFWILDLLNPIRRTADPAGVALYRGEPYVLAGDVRGAPPGEGQAGWTWYTGAAAWTWRLAVEGVLGLRIEDGAVRLAPALPPHWRGATLRLRGAGGTLVVRIEDPHGLGCGAVALQLDGEPVAGPAVPLPADGRDHLLVARIVPAEAPEGSPGVDRGPGMA